MHIICLTPLEDGVYNDHASDNIAAPPEGWAYIPEDFPLPATFPRLGSLEAAELPYTYEVPVEKDGEIVIEERTKTMLTVTKMTVGTLPKPEPAPDPISDNIWDELDAAYEEGVNSI